MLLNFWDSNEIVSKIISLEQSWMLLNQIEQYAEYAWQSTDDFMPC